MGKLCKRHNLDQRQEIRIIEQLITQPDRSVAIVAVSSLDRLLYLLIREYFYKNRLEKTEDDLFENSNGALHSFNSKIHVLYALGKIDDNAFHDLRLLQNVRNDFAHYVDIHDFSAERIADRCRELHIRLTEKDAEFLRLLSAESAGPRRSFLESVLKLISYLINARAIAQMAKVLGGPPP